MFIVLATLTTLVAVYGERTPYDELKENIHNAYAEYKSSFEYIKSSEKKFGVLNTILQAAWLKLTQSNIEKNAILWDVWGRSEEMSGPIADIGQRLDNIFEKIKKTKDKLVDALNTYLQADEVATGK